MPMRYGIATVAINMHVRNDNPLRQYRHRLGLSQEECARRAGVSLSTWANWENHRVAPTRRQYEAIATALEISLDEVFEAVSTLHRTILAKEVA